jgi:hypothetical protein
MRNENADASKVGFFKTPPERVVESCGNVRLAKPDDLGEKIVPDTLSYASAALSPFGIR